MGIFYYQLTYYEATLSICLNLTLMILKKGKEKKERKKRKKEERERKEKKNTLYIIHFGYYIYNFQKN